MEASAGWVGSSLGADPVWVLDRQNKADLWLGLIMSPEKKQFRMSEQTLTMQGEPPS